MFLTFTDKNQALSSFIDHHDQRQEDGLSFSENVIKLICWYYELLLLNDSYWQVDYATDQCSLNLRMDPASLVLVFSYIEKFDHVV